MIPKNQLNHDALKFILCAKATSKCRLSKGNGCEARNSVLMFRQPAQRQIIGKESSTIFSSKNERIVRDTLIATFAGMSGPEPARLWWRIMTRNGPARKPITGVVEVRDVHLAERIERELGEGDVVKRLVKGERWTLVRSEVPLGLNGVRNLRMVRRMATMPGHRIGARRLPVCRLDHGG